jgi:hypothetical protein
MQQNRLGENLKYKTKNYKDFKIRLKYGPVRNEVKDMTPLLE